MTLIETKRGNDKGVYEICQGPESHTYEELGAIGHLSTRLWE